MTCHDITRRYRWALAANVAIRQMGGPHVPTRFGRLDARSSADGVDDAAGRLPDGGDPRAAHLRAIFYPKVAFHSIS